MTNPADTFFGGGSKSAKFDQVGQSVGGPITHIGEPRQQTDFKTGDPLTWRDGSPRMQLPVTVQTTLRDPSDPTDDGKRTFYVKGEMRKAIEQALRAAGTGMQVGGVLTVTFSGEQPTDGGFPKKLYTATYQPPAAGGGFFEQPAAPVQAPPQQQWPQQQAPAPAPAPQPVAPTPAQPQMTPEQYAAYQAWQAEQARAQAPVPAASTTPAQYADYAAQMGFGQQQAPLPPVTDTPPF